MLDPVLKPKHRVKFQDKEWTYGYRSPPNLAASGQYRDYIVKDQTNFRPMMPMGNNNVNGVADICFEYGINGRLEISFEIQNPYITSGTSFEYNSEMTLMIGNETIIIPSLKYEFSSMVVNDVNTFGYIAKYTTSTAYTVNLTEKFLPSPTATAIKDLTVMGSSLGGSTVQGQLIIPPFGSKTYTLRMPIPGKHASNTNVYGWTNRVFQVSDVKTYNICQGSGSENVPYMPVSQGTVDVKSTMIFSQTLEYIEDADNLKFLGLARELTTDVNMSSSASIRVNSHSTRAITGTIVNTVLATPQMYTKMIEEDLLKTIKDLWTQSELIDQYEAWTLYGTYRPVNYNPVTDQYDESTILDIWELTITAKELYSNTTINTINTVLEGVDELWLPVGVTNLSNISEYLSRFNTMLEALREFQVDISEKVIVLEDRIKYVEQVMTNLINVVNQLSDAVNQLLQANSGNVGIQILNFVGSSIGNFLPVVGTIITILGGVLEGVSQINDGDWASGMMAITSGIILGTYVGHKYYQRSNRKLFQQELNTLQSWNIDQKFKNDLLKIHGTKVTTSVSNNKVIEPQSSSHYVRFNDDNGSIISLDLNDVTPMSLGMNDDRRNSNSTLLNFMDELESRYPLLPHEITFKNQLLYNIEAAGTRRGRGRTIEQNWSMELIGLFDDRIESLSANMGQIMNIAQIGKIEQFTLMMVYIGICGTQITSVIPVDTVYQIGSSFASKEITSINDNGRWNSFNHNVSNVPFRNTKDSLNFSDTVLYRLSKSDSDYLESLIQ